MVWAGDVLARALRPRNLVVAAVAAVAAACIGGTIAVLLLVPSTPLLVTAATRLGYRRTLRGRVRTANGHQGWATPSDINKARPKGRSTFLGWTTVGSPTPVAVRISFAASLLILGGQRMGKTLELIRIVLGHRGAGPRFVSSPRTDILQATIRPPRRGEAPAWVFVPEGVDGEMGELLDRMERAGWIRRMHWSPIPGCEDPKVAARRAAAMVDATDTGSPDDQTWMQSATTVLRCLLRLAALTGLSMRDVYAGVTNPDKAIPVLADKLHEYDPAWAAELASELLSGATDIVASVLRVVRQATEFVSDPTIAEACCPGPGDAVLDLRRMIENDETVHVIGEDRDKQGVQPLLAAFTTEVYETATQVAKEHKGKLPRPLLFALDELGVNIKVMLPKWLATAGGYNMHVVGVAQDPEQLEKRWPKSGIAGMFTNTLVFGGIENVAALHKYEELCGWRREPLPENPSTSEWRRVMPADRLFELPKFHALHVGAGGRQRTIVSTARWTKAAEVPVSATRVRLWVASKRTHVEVEAPQQQEQVTTQRGPIVVSSDGEAALPAAPKRKMIERAAARDKEMVS